MAKKTKLSRKEYYTKFISDGCPKCGSYEVKMHERTKGQEKYTVYVCAGCKVVVGRIFEKS
jgi:predicted RNA-binding Zn-ribbon protein involved in translation (DUF1610 family)